MLCFLAARPQQTHTDLSVNWSRFAYLLAVSLACKWREIQSRLPRSGEGLALRLTAQKGKNITRGKCIPLEEVIINLGMGLDIKG